MGALLCGSAVWLAACADALLCGSAVWLAACADPALLAAFAVAGIDEEDADGGRARPVRRHRHQLVERCPVADMLKVVQLFGGTAPDISGVKDKKAMLAESITEALLSLGDD